MTACLQLMFGYHGCERDVVEDVVMRTSVVKRFDERKEQAEVEVRQGEGYGRNAAGTGMAKEKRAQVYVTFPAVRTIDGSPVRAWDYSVRAELAAGDVVKTLCERCVFSEGVFYSEEDETKPVVCAFNRKDIPSRANPRQKVRFLVTPRSCWGVEGVPIASGWMSVDEIKKGEP